VKRILAAVALVAVAHTPMSGSTCAPLPLPESVSRARTILVGRVERVVYLTTNGVPESAPRPDDKLCGPKLVTFTVLRLLKGEAADTVTAFAEDGCLYLGGYYRVGEEVVALTLAATDPWVDAVARRAQRIGALRPPPDAVHVLHSCSGTRRLRKPNGDVETWFDGDAYLAEIRGLLKPPASPR
jgi:hypothetical protein